MPTTTNRNYSVPATGSDPGTWGENDLNPNFALIDNNLGGVTSIALTNVNVTLSSAQYQCGTIRLSGTLTGNVAIAFPSVQGWWSIDNLTTGAFIVGLTCGAGNNIAIPQGKVTDILTDGSNVKFRSLGVDIGEYVDYAGATVPLWISGCTVPPFLLCDGSTFSAGTYPYLAAVLGTTTLPGSQGRLRATLNGGTSRITTAGSGVDGDTRFSGGGSQNQPVLQANLPSVNFTVSGITINPFFTGSSPINVGVAGSAAVTTNNNNIGNYVLGTPTIANQGAAASGGNNTALTTLPPIYIGGITMIRAA